MSWQLAFVLLAAIWGSSFLFIKLALLTFAPIQVALIRLLLGALTLLLLIAARREGGLPRDRSLWPHLAFVALLTNALPFWLFAYGETLVPSLLAGIWNATTPLVTLVVVLLAFPEERPTRERLLGLGVGFVGVLVVLGFWREAEAGALLGNLACFAAAACYGLGYPYARRHVTSRDESVLALSAGQLLCAAVVVGGVTPLVSGPPTHVDPLSVASVAALGILGTGLAYLLNYRLLRSVGATTTSLVTYLIPLFSTLEGVALLGEPLTWNQPVGALVVVLGVALAQGRLPVRRGRTMPPRV